MVEKLTPRELEVANLLLIGLNSRQIGERLHITTRTVESHRREIWGKLGITHVSELYKIMSRPVIEPDITITVGGYYEGCKNYYSIVGNIDSDAGILPADSDSNSVASPNPDK